MDQEGEAGMKGRWTGGLLALAFVLASCGSGAGSAGPAERAGSGAQKAAAGVVLVTENLDLDFSTHPMTFIELGADRCIPCKAMQPIMKEIASEFAGKVQVVFYDVWKNPEPGRKHRIQLIPTQVFIDKTGREVFRHTGFFSKADLVAFLNKQGIH